MSVPKFKKFNLDVYKPGKSRIRNIRDIIKLSANESALGVSPNAQSVIKSKDSKLFRYPDPQSKSLRKTISKIFACDENRVICGAGSDEIIQMLCQLFLNPKDEVIVPRYSFLMYRIYANIVGAKVIFSEEVNYKISVKEIQLKPKIDTNDFKIKLNKSRKFLSDGDKVKFTMRFRGREAEHPEFGQRVLDNYKDELSDISEVESTSKPDGRSLTMVLAPMGGKK